MSSFVGYEKMPTLLKGFQLDEKTLREIDKYQWVVTEKIHGANFSCWYENKQLRFAKRKEYLQWTDDFFGFQLVVQQIEEKVLALFEELSLAYPAQRCTIYGELFGGAYPHAEVQADEHLQAIQTGIYYSPTINFCAFDIAIEPNNSPEDKFYLPYQEALQYFEQFGLFHAKPLLIGKLHEVMQFDIRIPSTVPAQLGLPFINGNLIEGIVVKPYKALPNTLPKRIIFKVKNPEFDESKEFHEAQKWSYVPVVPSYHEDLAFIADEIRLLITPNRLDSAISKVGQLDFANLARLHAVQQEVFDDIWVDFQEHSGELWEELTPAQQNWLVQRSVANIRELIEERRRGVAVPYI